MRLCLCRFFVQGVDQHRHLGATQVHQLLVQRERLDDKLLSDSLLHRCGCSCEGQAAHGLGGHRRLCRKALLRETQHHELRAHGGLDPSDAQTRTLILEAVHDARNLKHRLLHLLPEPLKVGIHDVLNFLGHLDSGAAHAGADGNTAWCEVDLDTALVHTCLHCNGFLQLMHQSHASVDVARYPIIVEVLEHEVHNGHPLHLALRRLVIRLNGLLREARLGGEPAVHELWARSGPGAELHPKLRVHGGESISINGAEVRRVEVPEGHDRSEDGSRRGVDLLLRLLLYWRIGLGNRFGLLGQKLGVHSSEGIGINGAEVRIIEVPEGDSRGKDGARQLLLLNRLHWLWHWRRWHWLWHWLRVLRLGRELRMQVGKCPWLQGLEVLPVVLLHRQHLCGLRAAGDNRLLNDRLRPLLWKQRCDGAPRIARPLLHQGPQDALHERKDAVLLEVGSGLQRHMVAVGWTWRRHRACVRGRFLGGRLGRRFYQRGERLRDQRLRRRHSVH
mmetsp:Transcript_100351/g.215041  ORF Transcript_100351/g.215041 Transcript_100351/m.215041 type:complete len:503 (-) Transcript_100351:615-2123(-)